MSFMLFFFKQKTAYEMRISDWSSDVCSSDLMADRRITLADEENLFFASRLLSRGIDLVSVVQALVVAEYLSFSAAASALGVRQSGVSKRIRLLEENLGVTLFERGPRGVDRKSVV